MTFSAFDFAFEEENYEVEPERDESTSLRCVNEACGFSEEWHPEVEYRYEGVPPHGFAYPVHKDDSLYCGVCGEPAEEVG